jgi:hypothetical protein
MKTNNEIESLKHRLAMVKDDLDTIRKFIYEEQLEKHFERPSETSDECWTNLNNIEIACDLTSDESLGWKKYKTSRTMKTISEIEDKLKELDLLYKETRKGRRTSEISWLDTETIEMLTAITEQGEKLYEEQYQMFLTKGIKIVDGGLTYVCILDDRERKFMAMLNTEFETVMSCKNITDEQYNAFV